MSYAERCCWVYFLLREGYYEQTSLNRVSTYFAIEYGLSHQRASDEIKGVSLLIRDEETNVWFQVYFSVEQSAS